MRIVNFLLMVAILILGCNTSKEAKDSVSSKIEVDDMDSLIDFKKQVFKINSLSDTSFTGQSGTKIVLKSGTLQVLSGEVYSGFVSVELVEFYDLSEMVINNLSAETIDGKMLSTGGMIYLNFLDSLGSQLSIVPNKNYELWFKKEDTLDKREMHLFKGQRNIEDSPCVKWKKTNDSLLITDQVWGLADKVTVFNFNSNTVDYFIFNSTTIGWINCDAFVKYADKSNLTSVKIMGGSNIAHRLIDKKTKSIGVLYQERKEGYYEFNMVQPGNEYYLLSFYKQDGDYYYFMKDFLAKKEGNEFTPEFVKTDLAGLKAQAEKLDN